MNGRILYSGMETLSALTEELVNLWGRRVIVLRPEATRVGSSSARSLPSS